MAQLSDRLNRLAPSATLAMSQKSNEMKAQGIDVINMSVGEPDYMTPDHIKEAGKKAIKNINKEITELNLEEKINIPVFGIDNVQVMALVIAFTAPNHRIFITRNQPFHLQV